MTILSLNVGSSSLKAGLFANDDGTVQELDRLTLRTVDGSSDHGISQVLDWIGLQGPPPDLIGHRMVHGGTRFTAPVIVDDDVIIELQQLAPLAPLHLPLALDVLKAARAAIPAATQVACFDTGFHATLPRIAHDLGLPPSLRQEGIRRYGFHGINCEHVVRTLGAERMGRAVIAHLGNGCSLTAVRDGRSIATTMGFTPTGGIPMSTRSGDLDPGVVIYLLRQGYDVHRIAEILEHESGVSAWSRGKSDISLLLESDDADDQFAVDAFCSHISQAVAALTVSLGGLDTLVFTGGIGEHCEPVRHRVLARLAHLAPFATEVVPADEERMMAVLSATCAAGRTAAL